MVSMILWTRFSISVLGKVREVAKKSYFLNGHWGGLGGVKVEGRGGFVPQKN